MDSLSATGWSLLTSLTLLTSLVLLVVWSDSLLAAVVVSSVIGAAGSFADDELVCMTEPSAKPAVMTITPSAAPMRSLFLSML